MLIHFAFGDLKDDVDKQTNEVIEKIIIPKRLKISKCPEFIPSLPIPGSILLDPEDFFWEVGGVCVKPGRCKDSSELKRATPSDIAYHPTDVPMICFIKINLSQLKTSPHSHHYGKFGIVLEASFFKKYPVKPVYYYTEDSLSKDVLLKELHKLQHTRNRTILEKEKIEKLMDEILFYRKPKTLFPNFLAAQSKVMRFVSQPSMHTLSISTYNRYSLHYDFSQEKEHRISFNRREHPEYVSFEERDIHGFIVPNQNTKTKLESALASHFKNPPQVILFPRS